MYLESIFPKFRDEIKDNLEDMLSKKLDARLNHKQQNDFYAIYDEYRAPMLMYAAQRVSLEVAEDLVHDVFMRLWNNMERIELGERIVGYLFKALRNVIIDHIAKSNNAQKYLDSIDIFAQSYKVEQADDKLREDMFLKSIEQLLGHFNEQSLKIFRMRIQGFSNHEIADNLKISEKTVRNSYSIMLKYLREKILILMFLHVLLNVLWDNNVT